MDPLGTTFIIQLSDTSSPMNLQGQMHSPDYVYSSMYPKPSTRNSESNGTGPAVTEGSSPAPAFTARVAMTEGGRATVDAATLPAFMRRVDDYMQ